MKDPNGDDSRKRHAVMSSWRDHVRMLRDGAVCVVSVDVVREQDVLRRHILAAAVHIRARGQVVADAHALEGLRTVATAEIK